MSVAVVALMVTTGVALAGCAEKEDPLEVKQSVVFTDIRDGTNSEYYTVRSEAIGVEDGIGARITLGFDVTFPNSITINPVSTIHFPDDTTVLCEADFRRLPGLVDTLDTWDFECDPGEFPEETDGAYIVVVDEYH